MDMITYFGIKIRAFQILLRRVITYRKLKSFDSILLSNVSVRFRPNSIQLGQRFTVLQNSILEFNDTAAIKIGNNCLLSYGVVMAIRGDFVMGNNVMVGEYSSIRDYTHDYSVNDIPMISSKDIVYPIKIGNNVWIGRGCIIMPGTIIEDGVVVGANSVVKGHLKSNAIYAGSPLKFIKNRI